MSTLQLQFAVFMKAKTFTLLVLHNAISILLSSIVTAAARFHTFMLTAESAHCQQKANRAVFLSSTAVWKHILTWLHRQASKWPKALFSILFSLKLKFVSGLNKNRLNLHPALEGKKVSLPIRGNDLHPGGMQSFLLSCCKLQSFPLPWSAESQCW